MVVETLSVIHFALFTRTCLADNGVEGMGAMAVADQQLTWEHAGWVPLRDTLAAIRAHYFQNPGTAPEPVRVCPLCTSVVRSCVPHVVI
jgi:hypothetical protein